MPKISSCRLVEELRVGDRLGCLHLVEVYRKRLIDQGIREFNLDPLDSEEIVDDVLVSIVRKINSFSFRKSESDFHYWVMAIFRNKIRDFIRRRFVRFGNSNPVFERVSHDEDGNSNGDALAHAAIQEYERSVLESDGACGTPSATRWVTELLEEMEPWERVLLWCRALEVPYNDIARYTDKTAEQLKVYYSRVRKKFARLMAKRYPEVQESISNDLIKKKTAGQAAGISARR